MFILKISTKFYRLVFILLSFSIINYNLAFQLSAKDCLSWSLENFYVAALSHSLSNITVGDNVFFLLASSRHPNSNLLCSEETLTKADNFLKKFISGKIDPIKESELERQNQTSYGRINLVGKQYGTDKNDG